MARPHILLVTIDTFRADRLRADVTPTLDRLASTSMRFTVARTAVPLTLPSHTTILTGLWPPAHGVRENGLSRLGGQVPTVATVLKQAGYKTAAFVGAFVLDRRFGLARGFDTYDDRIERDPRGTDRLEAERPASAVIDSALTWLDQAVPADHASAPAPPFFAWIHLYDPHAPYRPPADFQTRFTNPYDGELAFADSQIARVFDWLQKRGAMARTLVVVAGDHGEGLNDHGERTHGMLLYDSTLRVPLVVAEPGRPAGTRADAVSLVDVAPTILKAAGVAVPSGMTGIDLLDRTNRRSSEVYAETEYPRTAGWSALQAITDGRWMTIAGSATEVYDLQRDPGQTQDVAASHGSMVAAAAARIKDIRARAAGNEPGTVSPETAERLRALGYVATRATSTDRSTDPNPAATIAAWNAFEDALAALNERRSSAIGDLARLAREYPAAPVFQQTYARALKDAGRVEDALRIYRNAARRWPADSMLLHDLAVAAYDAAGRADPPRARALLDEASRAEQAALATAPTNAAARNGLGLVAAAQERSADALQSFEAAVTLDPNNASYWVNVGNARRAAGNATGAEEAYRHALEVDRRSLDAANGLGVLLVETDRPADAIPWLEQAAASPDFVEARLNLGIALQQSGDTARAADAYRDVMKAPARFARERAAAKELLASLGAR